MRTPLIIAYSLLLLGCYQQPMKNPFAVLDREKALRECRAEVMELPNMTTDVVEFLMAMHVQSLDALSRIPVTRKNREHLQDTLDFAYPNFIAAKGLYEQMYGQLPDQVVGTNTLPNQAVQRTGASGSDQVRSRASSAAGSRR